MVINIIHTKMRSVLFTVLLVLLMTSTSIAATYYVDTNNSRASDSNSGSESSPWKTIQKGANVAVAGDTVYVKAGTYKEQVIVKNSGTLGKPITLMAYPGDKPIIDGSGVALSGYKGLLQTDNKNYITFDGFHVKNSVEVLIRATYGKGIIIRNCLAHSNSYRTDGIYLYFLTDSFVDNNELYDCGWNAIQVMSCTNTDVRYNYIHDHSNHAAINVFPHTTSQQAVFYGNDIIGNRLTGNLAGNASIYTRYQADNIIANNIIYNNGDVGIKLDIDRNEANMTPTQFVFRSNTKIYNNTLVKNGGPAAIHIINATHTSIKNNLFSNNSGTISIKSTANTGHVVDYNMYDGSSYPNKGSHGFNAAAGFNGAEAHDYSLTAQSAAIDRGQDLSSEGVTTDITGKSRPQGSGFDIGAHEYSDGGTLSPPANLKIIVN